MVDELCIDMIWGDPTASASPTERTYEPKLFQVKTRCDDGLEIQLLCG